MNLLEENSVKIPETLKDILREYDLSLGYLDYELSEEELEALFEYIDKEREQWEQIDYDN